MSLYVAVAILIFCLLCHPHVLPALRLSVRRFGLVYGILVILGIGTLLPWNVFITETEFFDVRLHVEPSSPAIANNYISLFGLVFNGA